MKKSMSVVLILTLFLVGGCLESGIEEKYVSTKYPGDYIELNSDGTFFVYQEVRGSFSGTYEIKDDTIRLIFPNGRVQVGKLEGNNIMDPDGDVWKKE